MEREIREIYKSIAQQIDLDLSTKRLNSMVKETLTYDYKLSGKVDELKNGIERLRKKIIIEYVRIMTTHLETKIMQINKIQSQNLENKHTAIISVLEERVKYDASNKIEDFMEEYLMPYKRLAEIREYEDLYIDLRRHFLNYIDSVNKEIQITNSRLAEKMKNISYGLGNEELEKSNSPLYTEMLGINVDRNQNCFWIYNENGEEKKKLKPLNAKGTIYSIDNATFFVIEQKEEGTIFKICTRTQNIKEVFVSKNTKRVAYMYGDTKVAFEFFTKKVVVIQNKEKYEFDLSDYSIEKEQELRQLLGEENLNLIEFFERLELIKTPSNTFK